MSINLKEVTDKSQWEEFIFTQQSNSFLQSWNWGEVRKNLGEKIFRLGVFDENEKLIGVCLIIKVLAKRGTFLHCAYGPLLDFHNPEIFKEFVKYLKSLGKTEKAWFIRINPLLPDNPENRTLFLKNGFKDAPVHLMNPELSWILELDLTEDELFNNMRKNTRYLIRKAVKDGVKIKISDSKEDLETFYGIHLDTVKRHHFIPFSYETLKTQLEIFKKDDQIEIFSAEFDGKIIASAIIVFYGKEASYHHAASLSEYAKIPASYLIQWEVIKEAKKRGLSTYNFWGIVENKPSHPWAGLSFFKKSFGGYDEKYLHVQDLPLSPKYFFTQIVEKLRKLKRGY